MSFKVQEPMCDQYWAHNRSLEEGSKVANEKFPWMDKFLRKCIFLGEIANVGGGLINRVSRAFENT